MSSTGSRTAGPAIQRSGIDPSCINLIGHYFEKDKVWKDQYVKNLKTFDWNIEYSGDVFSGTGCLYADKLLSPYVLNQMVVI